MVMAPAIRIKINPAGFASLPARVSYKRRAAALELSATFTQDASKGGDLRVRET